MGYWENTTYVNVSDPARVIVALESSFAREGMQRVPEPPPRERLHYEPMQYAGALENDLWGVAAFPGAASWTVIKTAPLELLGERASSSSRMRLSDLCQALSTPAFQVHIYDSGAMLLCEVSNHGDAFLSGYGHFGNPLEWHGQSLREEFVHVRFRHLPYQEVVGDETSGDDLVFALSRTFGGPNSEYCDNRVSVGALVTHIHPEIPGGLFAYFNWPGCSRARTPPCSWEEWRRQARAAWRSDRG